MQRSTLYWKNTSTIRTRSTFNCKTKNRFLQISNAFSWQIMKDYFTFVGFRSITEIQNFINDLSILILQKSYVDILLIFHIYIYERCNLCLSVCEITIFSNRRFENWTVLGNFNKFLHLRSLVEAGFPIYND